MRATGIYGLVWGFVLAAASVLYFTGSFNEITLPIFAFVLSTLVVMGFVAVLPAWMDHYFAPKTYSAARLARISNRQPRAKAPTARNIHGGFS